jgi:membrane-associated phospholipid phosphatase
MNASIPLDTSRVVRPTAERALQAAAALLSVYELAAVAPMINYTRISGAVGPLAVHALLLALSTTAALAPQRLPVWLRTWLLQIIGPLLYVELRWLIPGTALPHQDARVRGWEAALLHDDPSRTLAPRFHDVALSELFHLAYASYYALIYVPPVLLYLRGRRDEYAATILALAVTYAVCFAAYLVFPVDGPRFIGGPASAPDGPIRSAVLWLLALGSSRGTGFPSSHVAASVTASICALRYQPRVGAIVTAATALLVVATVYGGFHYGVDALAGLLTGALASAMGATLWRRLATDGAQSATAAW